MNYGDPTEASVKFYKDYLNPDDFRALEKLEIDGVSKPYTTQDYRQRTLCKVVKLKEVIPAHPANIKEDYVQLEKLALAVKQEREFVRWLKSKVDGMYIRIDEDFKDCEFEHVLHVARADQGPVSGGGRFPRRRDVEPQGGRFDGFAVGRPCSLSPQRSRDYLRQRDSL